MKIIYYLGALYLVFNSCTITTKNSEAKSHQRYVTTASGLQYAIVKQGRGTRAKEGQEVLIFETTSYLNGTVLYSNENSTSPVQVLIGGHQATQGMDEGLRGMRVGEVRKLICPPNLVKRTTYPDNVSPDSNLMIKIILHKIL